MKVTCVPVLDDNFAYLLTDEAGVTAAIDPAEAEKVKKRRTAALYTASLDYAKNGSKQQYCSIVLYHPTTPPLETLFAAANLAERAVLYLRLGLCWVCDLTRRARLVSMANTTKNNVYEKVMQLPPASHHIDNTAYPPQTKSTVL